jgi:hypothetical protein
MLRAPMSRMDILSKSELSDLLEESSLIKKYNDFIDRKSAYEMLGEKIKKAEAVKAKEDEREAKEAAREKNKRSSTKSTTTRRRRSTAMNPIVKVLTSATFIRSVFGILKKVMK